MTLPRDAKSRKDLPLFSGVLAYFPDALAAVAQVSRVGNDQHNPGEPLHWDNSKSNDHADSLVRHLLERGTTDTDGTRHTAKVAWRALALLQIEIEEESREAVTHGGYLRKEEDDEAVARNLRTARSTLGGRAGGSYQNFRTGDC